MINILYCDSCSFKKLFKNISDINLKEFGEKKYKCPNCGRLIKLKKAQDPQKELDLKLKKQNQQEELKKWKEELDSYREEFIDE